MHSRIRSLSPVISDMIHWKEINWCCRWQHSFNGGKAIVSALSNFEGLTNGNHDIAAGGAIYVCIQYSSQIPHSFVIRICIFIVQEVYIH
jgi:hypothetical protein